METALVIWIALAAAFAVTELATMGFVALYFSIGSIAAAFVAWQDGSLEWQLAAFLVASMILLLLTRPVLRRHIQSEDIPTNVHQLIGKGGIVTIAIDNDANTGQIRIGTEYWTARLADDSAGGSVPVDERVKVVAVEGVTARVERAAVAASATE